MFQQRLKKESKQISATEESIYSELEVFESSSLQEVTPLAPPTHIDLSTFTL